MKARRDGEIVALNFRVPAEDRREFRAVAVRDDLTMPELLMKGLEAYERERAGKQPKQRKRVTTDA
jgi:hypothetical protein